MASTMLHSSAALRRTFVLACCLLASTFSAAALGIASLSGTVYRLDEGSRVPFQGVVVTPLSDENSAFLDAAVADSAGHFRLDGVPAIRVRLSATREGYLTGLPHPKNSESAIVDCSPGGSFESIDFTWENGASLSA